MTRGQKVQPDDKPGHQAQQSPAQPVEQKARTMKPSKKIAPDKSASHSSMPNKGKMHAQSTSSDGVRGSVTTTDRLKVKHWSEKQNKMRLYHLDKHLKFEMIGKSQLSEMERWKVADMKGNRKTLYIKEVQKKNDNILNVIEQSRLEKLENYEDRFPMLDCRKSLQKLRIYINQFAYAIISHKIFENATITIILLNSLTLGYENPMIEPERSMEIIDNVFLALYTFEMCMKILGQGFFLNKGAYLRDFWGVLDFVIVMSAYFTMLQAPEVQGIVKPDVESGGLNLSALRAFRVLRPLRTITSIKGLRVLVVSILSAFPMLQQTIMVLFFFFLIFAIAGVQLLSGLLKLRCVDKVTGVVFEDGEGEQIFCGGAQTCVEMLGNDDYFCGKCNENPAYGSTNLDNIFYALLMVFQCTTLEGWSDIQTYYQKTYSEAIFLYFVSMVFIGAFFLMNLTLAVINAAFTKSQKEASAKSKPADDNLVNGEDEEINLDEIDIGQDEEKANGEIGISEFFIAKRAAKKMIEWLRLRQQDRARREIEDKEKARLEALAGNDNPFAAPESPMKPRGQSHTNTQMPAETGRSSQPMLMKMDMSNNSGPLRQQAYQPQGMSVDDSAMKSFTTQPLEKKYASTLNPDVAPINVVDSVPVTAQGPRRHDLIITEEELEDEANLQNHNEVVARFLADLESDVHSLPESPGRMSLTYNPQQKGGLQTTGMANIQDGIRQRGWVGNGPDALKPMKQTSHVGTARNQGVGEKMTVAGYTFNDRFSETSKIHDELDFDKIITAGDDEKDQVHRMRLKNFEPLESGEGFDSFNNDDSPLFCSDDLDDDIPRHNQNSMDDLDSVIDSDNSLHMHLENLKEQQRMANQEKMLKKRAPPEVTSERKEMIKSLKQKIRRYQTSNYDERDPLGEVSQSTIAGGRKKRNELISQTQMSGTLYNQGPGDKTFTSGKDQGVVDPALQKSVSIAAMMKMKKMNELMEKKKAMSMQKVDETFLKMASSKDPYDFIDKKTQKIDINPGVAYKSTSANEVFEPRIFINRAKALTSVNPYIAKPVDPEEDDSEDYGSNNFYMQKCDPYQIKTVYAVIPDDPLEDDSEENEDDLQDQPQPFQTVMSIGFNNHLSHLNTKMLCRRSDILVSATLSLTMTPQEQGAKKKNLVEMNTKQLKDWVDLRHEFNAKAVNMHEVPVPNFIPGYYSNEMRQTFKAEKQQQFQSSFCEVTSPKSQIPLAMQNQQKQALGAKYLSGMAKLLPPNLLRDPLSPEQQQLLNDEERKTYNVQKNKYEAAVRTNSKRAVPVKDTVVTLADAKKLHTCMYYEDDDDEILDETDMPGKQDANLTKYLGRDEDFNIKTKLENFEKDVNTILAAPAAPTTNNNKGDEVPSSLREELDLPKSLGSNEIDYCEVREKDCNIKRKRPHWSGQDILSDNLNYSKSTWIVEQMNEVRVWPKGFFGIMKKFQCILKIIVKHAIFDNAMLSSVVFNTIIMANESFSNSQEKIAFLSAANEVFTWVFIVEMSLKLLAIGPRKYVQEAMNILDGSVVLLSIVEIAMASGGDSQLSAFKTMRILRTLRVLRIVRILRALKQMQVIIAVIKRSANSFVYIAMLLLVCCFIFTLLGKTIFGNKLNYLPRPRGNFDSFQIAFITVFQVLTMENWQTVAFDAMRSEVGKWVPVFYFVTWIFIGNFILLNLFLAILLDSFLEEDEEGEMSEDQEQAMKDAKQKKRETRERERMRKLRKLGMNMFRSGNVQNIIRQQTMKKKAAFATIVNAQYNRGDDLIVDDIEDLDADAIKEMFMDQGILKDKTNKRKKAQMYNGVFCEHSFYLFQKTGGFRKFFYSVSAAKWFDNTVMVLIGLNSVKLGVDTYLQVYDKETTVRKVSDLIDYFFNIAFAIECFFKCISLGLIMDRGSYLRDGWNQLDFFIVVTSLMDMILGFFITLDIGFFKILRLLRTLRPLRVISHNVAMKMIVAALFESVGAIFNVLIVVLVVWLMFAILAINLLSGKSFYCSTDIYTHSTKFSCNTNGGSWETYDSNWDNIIQAMMSLFIISTLEGWPDIMIQSVDSTKQGQGPEYEASTPYIYFYIVFILIGSFFLLNFFIGVLFLEYAKAQREEQKGYTPAHINWVSIQTMITDASVAHDKRNMPEVRWRFRLWKIVESKPFELFIMLFIILNMLQMAADYEGAPQSMNDFLRITNYIFTFVFCFEAVLKLMVYRATYFQTAWNKFDFFVVCASLFDLSLEFVDTEDMKDLPIGNVAKVLRVLRVSRVLRLAQSSQEIQALLQTINMSVVSLMNVFALLLLILFMFAVLGVFFFNELSSGQVIDAKYKNFKNFGSAYLLLFAISTGEDWNRLMYDCVDTQPDCVQDETCGVGMAPVYFISFIFVISHVMLNLFILVIIQQFDQYYVAEDNPIKTFKNSFTTFHDVWVDFTQRFRCVRIKEKQLVDFFSSLPVPMGMKTPNEDERMSNNELKKQMLKMGIRTEDGWIFFNELLYRCMRRVYGNFKLNKRMQIIELKTLFRISIITLKTKNDYGSKLNHNEAIIEELTKKGQSVNPFLTLMYYRISFMTWLHAMRKDKALREQGDWGKTSPRGFQVEQGSVEVMIEVEEIVEYTSEEDAVDPVGMNSPKGVESVAPGKNEKLKKLSASKSANRSTLGASKRDVRKSMIKSSIKKDRSRDSNASPDQTQITSQRRLKIMTKSDNKSAPELPVSKEMQ